MMNFAVLTLCRMPGAVFRHIGNTFNRNIVAVNQSLTFGHQKRSIVTAITRSEVTKCIKSAPTSKWLQPIRYVHEGEGQNPKEFDVVVTDINEEILKGISHYSENKYLSVGEVPDPKFPVKGLIYGHNQRLLVCLNCKVAHGANAPIIKIWFLLVTSSPYTFISAAAIKTLSQSDWIPTWTPVKIQGVGADCFVSHGHFADINILGMDYMINAKLSLIMDYKKFSFHLIYLNAAALSLADLTVTSH